MTKSRARWTCRTARRALIASIVGSAARSSATSRPTRFATGIHRGSPPAPRLQRGDPTKGSRSMATIRSGFCIEGTRLFCEESEGSFLIASRWQRFHKTGDVHEALAVFEGLCLEDSPTKAHAKRLVQEARRNIRSRFSGNAAWERRVIECARRRSEGLRPVICGSKGSIESWV